MKKSVLTIMMLVMFMTGVMAVPAYRGTITKSLPDGSTIDLLLHGDEFFNYYTTTDGYLVKQTADGYYQYASMENGVKVATGVRATNAAHRTDQVRDMLRIQGVFRMTEAEFRSARKASVMYRKRPSEGQQRIVGRTMDDPFTKNLVILVNFSDETFTRTNTEFTNQFNQVGYSDNNATGSVKDYFVDNSYGQYSPVFDVYGPVTLSHNMAYYGAPSDDDYDIRPAQMALDAVRKLSQTQSITVNWSDYDCDNDGYIDNVIIYYAGYGENMGADEDCVWPHQWYVTPDNTDAQNESDHTFGGKVLSKYICMNELYGTYGTQMCGIGTFCHEFSHALGLMDLYVTDYSSDHKSVGDWDLMCSGSYNNDEHTPSGYSMFERFYIGWSEPTMLNAPSTISMPSTIAANSSYVITSTGAFNNDPEDPQPDVYYILENRQKTKWDTYLPGHGMLVEKITWDAQSWYYNIGNNDPDNMVVDIIEAGNSTNVDGSASDPFPGTSNVRTFTPYTNYPLTNIAESGGVITFDFMGGALPDTYSVYFNAGRNGVADTTSLSQAEVGDTIILPGATSSDGLDFVGWSYQIEAAHVNAGNEGDPFVPQANVLLHAVYAESGEIVPNNFDSCFVEKFAKLPKQGTVEVTTTINSYTDSIGWAGSKLVNNKGVLQVGDNDVQGTITTPCTGLMGDVEVTLVVSQKTMSYLGVVTEDEMAADYALARRGMGVLYYTLNDVTPDSRLVISSDLYSFDIMAVYICGEKVPEPEPEGVEEVEAGEGAVLIRRDKALGNARVERIEAGSVVKIIDALGRVLSEETAESDVYEFTAPECFYMVEVMNGNKREVLK